MQFSATGEMIQVEGLHVYNIYNILEEIGEIHSLPRIVNIKRNNLQIYILRSVLPLLYFCIHIIALKYIC